MDRLKGKTAIVVGAGSIGPGWGNGKATAVTFAREGAQVFCVDRNGEAAEETADVYTRISAAVHPQRIARERHAGTDPRLECSEPAERAEVERADEAALDEAEVEQALRDLGRGAGALEVDVNAGRRRLREEELERLVEGGQLRAELPGLGERPPPQRSAHRAVAHLAVQKRIVDGRFGRRRGEVQHRLVEGASAERRALGGIGERERPAVAAPDAAVGVEHDHADGNGVERHFSLAPRPLHLLEELRVHDRHRHLVGEPLKHEQVRLAVFGLAVEHREGPDGAARGDHRRADG